MGKRSRLISLTGLTAKVMALPLAGHITLALAMYGTKGWLADLIALVFVVGGIGAVFFLVYKNLRISALRYAQGDFSTPSQLHNEIEAKLGGETSLDRLVFAARSLILYTLLAGYLVVALVFALAYDALEVTPVDSLLANFYFSLTTLATVGYGDIAPLGFGRLLACIEMVTGLTYQVVAIGGGMAYFMSLGKERRANSK
jgi:hypothetical protein